MTGYLLRRLVTSVVLLFLCSIIIFVGLRVIPGDPLSIYGSTPGFTSDQLEEIRHELGLDRSIPQQYLSWIGGTMRGDFGRTYYNPNFTTNELIAERLIPTVELAFVSILLALLLAVPLGIASAMRPFSLFDRLVSGSATATIALPPFWAAILLIAIFSVRLDVLPTRGYVSIFDEPIENLRFITLPALALAIVLSGVILRFLRSSLLETLNAEFVRTAHGKGLLRRQVVLGHAFPNALLPTLTVVGVLVGSMVGGVVIIEFIFGWPGLGDLAMNAILKRDYAVLQALLLLAAAMFIVSSLVVDLVSFALDPRLRLR